MAKKRTDRIRALDAINTLWNNYDAKCEDVWRDAVNLMAHMLEFMPGKKFKFDPKKRASRHFKVARLSNLDRDPVVEISDCGLPGTWYDFADVDWETQRCAIGEVRDKLFKGVEL